jgi:glycolate oxidase
MKIRIQGIPQERILTEPEETYCYGFDASRMKGTPDAVVKPVSTDEVSSIASFALKNKIPIVPRGAGSGMTAGAVPMKNSIIVSVESLNRIIEIDENNLVAVVEPGVINSDFQKELESRGLFYPPDPSSMKFCTLGGNVAENAGGPRAVKYGVTGDYVLGLEIVLANGTILTTGVKTYKGVVGYDLTRLLVGSEGTLAMITKIFFRVLPLPEETMTLLCSFTRTKWAGAAVSKITASRIIPRVLEFMDHNTIQAVENYKPYGLPRDIEALLLIEVDGQHKKTNEDAEKVASICTSLGADVKVAEDNFSKQRLWEARRAISPALYQVAPTKINEDIVVPRSRIPDMLEFLEDIANRFRIKIVNFGHAGDGNIHVNIMTDKNNSEEYQRAQDAVKVIFEGTIKMGGTLSGEHGVGLTKAPYIGMELPPENISIMKAIKKVFDPENILNPGKIFPPD